MHLHLRIGNENGHSMNFTTRLALALWWLPIHLNASTFCSCWFDTKLGPLIRRYANSRLAVSKDISVRVNSHLDTSGKTYSQALLGLRLKGGSAPGGQVIKCTYSQEWDNQGVLFLIGSMPPFPQDPGSSGGWFNPAQIGRVRIHCGPGGYIGIRDISLPLQPEVQLDPSIVIDRVEQPGCCFFPDGWVAIELPPNFQLLPHHYTLRNGGGTVVACMTGWVLEGSQSIDGPWQPLDQRGTNKNVIPMEEHQCTVFNDLAAKTPRNQWPHHSVTFEVRAGQSVVICGDTYHSPGHYNRGYRVFRLRMLQNRMPFSNNMCVSPSSHPLKEWHPHVE